MKHRLPRFSGKSTAALCDRKTLLIFISGLLMSFSAAAAEPVLLSVKHGTHTYVAGDSFNPSLSADGHVIAFESRARLTIDDKNRVRDIYVLDVRKNDMKRVPSPSKVVLNSGPCISRDGTVVAFHVYSSAVFPSKTPRTAEIYLCNVDKMSVAPLFATPRSELKGGESLFPMLSRDNNMVLFTANSDDRVRQVYLVDREHDLLSIVSKTENGAMGNRPSGMARLSANGGTCVFLSAATNLDSALPVTSLSMHLYISDLSEGTVRRIDTFEQGVDDREWILGTFDISDDARIIVFEARHRSGANPYVTLNRSDLFITDAEQHKSTLMTEGLFSDSSRDPSLSGDGRFVAFVLIGKKQNRLVVFDRVANAWKEATVGPIDNPVISKNGCVIVFERADKKIHNIYTVPNPFTENDDACH